jgi:hypothetical protein
MLAWESPHTKELSKCRKRIDGGLTFFQLRKVVHFVAFPLLHRFLKSKK